MWQMIKPLLLVPLGIGWYKYVTQSEGLAYLIGLLLMSVVLFFLLRADFRRTAAANNVVAAAATWQCLGATEQQAVHQRAIELIQQSGWRGSSPPKLETDTGRYGWYALSMGAMGIKPVCITNGWNHVRNPFIAVSGRDQIIKTVVAMAAKQGHNVVLRDSVA